MKKNKQDIRKKDW